MKKSELKEIIKETLKEQDDPILDSNEFLGGLKSNIDSILEKYSFSISDDEQFAQTKEQWMYDFTEWLKDNGANFL